MKKTTKIDVILRRINKYGAVHLCLALLFAHCWFIHYLALTKMEMFDRQFLIMDKKTIKSMILIDFVNSHLWMPIAYACLIVITVLSSQHREHPSWCHWCLAIVLSIPCIVYWSVCAYIQGKFVLFPIK